MRTASGDLEGSLGHHTTPSGTRFSVQGPANATRTARADVATTWAVLFDGLPMIEDGVPGALVAAQVDGLLPPTSAVYVESIEAAEKRGPTRCASLTTASVLDRFATELDGFLAATVHDEQPQVVLVGHSLGAMAAMHIASSRAHLARDVVLLSPALWWPGENGQLSGDATIDELVAARHVQIWITAGAQEERKLLESNDELCRRLGAAGRPFVRQSHPGQHEVRPEDVVDGIRALVAKSAA